jgi:hypothetical protein
MQHTRLLGPSLLATFLLATAGAAHAQTPFDGCGTIVPGVTCPKLFQADAGGLWVLSTYGSFVVGDVVRVTGTADPSCITLCQQGGCILNNSIQACAVCACTTSCAGDGTGAACPCGNTGAPGHGCASSVNPAGGLLSASGSSSLPNDTVVLAGSGMPDAPVLYFQGTSLLSPPAAFGDGLRCAGGTVLRLGTKSNVGGASQFPAAGDPAVSVRGLIGAPGAREYQAWYRNVAPFCTPAGFNLTNSVSIVWSA